MKLLGLLLLLVTTTAVGATSATILLKGIIPQVLDVAITPDAVSTTLPLATAQTNLKVGSVVQKSNSSTGYKITIASTNLGKLLLNSTNSIPYTLTYGGNAVNLATSQVFTFPFTSGNSVNKDLNITYSAADTSLMAGDYTDTLTLTIAQN